MRTGGIFYFPWHSHRHQIQGTHGFECLLRHWQSGVNGIAKFPKQSFPQWDSNPIRTVRSPAQANALTHSVTAPSTPSRPPRPQSYSRPGRPLLLFPGANVHSSTKLVVFNSTSRPSTGTTLLTTRYCPSKNPTRQVQLAVRQLGLHNSFSECYQREVLQAMITWL